MVLSTLREVQPVVKVGDVDKEVGPLTKKLVAGIRELIEAETAG